MRGRFLIALLLAGLGVDWATSSGRCEETGSNSEILSVSLVLSDSDILVSDAILYKLHLRNHSRSLIYLSKAPTAQGFTLFLDYRRQPSKKWMQVAEISAATMGAKEGELAVPGKQTFATYGKFFTNVERKVIFSLPGDYDVRIRVKCLLGDFATEERTVHVVKRPHAEVEAIAEHMKVLDAYVDFSRFTNPPEKYFAKLRPSIHAGSVERTMRMFDGLSEFMKTQSVAGETCSTAVAFRKLSKGLDEVRRDQLALTLLWNDMEAKKWRDVEELLPELKEESAYQRAIQSELQSAIRRELKKRQMP